MVGARLARASGLRLFMALAFLCFFNLRFAYALPEGETIIEGTATFDRSEPNTLKINTSSDKLIVDYNSFSIGANESVYFYQPSSGSEALNRVTGSDVSNIFGSLTANGIIYLINSNGINIGSSANINAAGFIASTLNIANADFLTNKFVFSKLVNKIGRPVINNGYIRVRETGQVALLGSAVANAGTIETTLGSAVLAAGEQITLNLDTAGMISVVIDKPVQEEIFGFGGEKLTSAVSQSGSILNPGGKVILAAKVLNNVFDYAINNTGIVQAQSLVNHDGVVELVGEGAPILNAGTVEATRVSVSAKAAPVTNTGEIKAEEVTVVSEAAPVVNTGKIEAEIVTISVTDSDFTNKGVISANGNEQMIDGGRVSVEAGIIAQLGSITANAFEGGDAGDITIISESSTVLGEASQTEARALGIVGNGGRILIDSRRGNTLVDKNAVIDVSAGLVSGNGGFIEVSAFDQLGFYGVLSGRAPPGYELGIAILDPTDATVSGIFAANTTIWATNNITINGNVTINRGFTLTLLADHNETSPGVFNWDDGVGSITRSGAFTITGQSGPPNQTRGLVMKAGSGIGTSSNPIFINNITDLSADLNPTAGSGGIFISQSGTRALTVSSATTRDGDINISAASDITVTTVTTGVGNINITSEGDMTVTTATAGGTGTITLEVSGGTNTLTTGAITAVDNDITLTAGAIDITDTVNAGTGNITLQPSTTNRAININSGATQFSLTVTELTRLSSSGTVTIGRTDSAANISIGSDGAIDLSAEDYNLTIRSASSAITISGALTLKSGKALVLNAGTNTVTQDAAINVGSGTITITGSTIALNSTITATGDITLNGNTTFTGTLTVGTGALLTINGNLTINLAGATLNAAAGTVDLNGDFNLSAGTFTAPTGNFNITGSFTVTGGTFTHSSGTVIFDGATAGKTITSGGVSFYNLTFNGAGGSWTLQDALDVDNNLTLTAGTLDVSANNYSVTIGGSFTLTGGVFTARNGTMTFNSTIAGRTITSGGTSFYDMTFNGAGGEWTLQDNLDIDNNLALTAGTLDVSANSYSITIGGNFTRTGGAFTARQGTVTFNDRTKSSTIIGSITFFNFTSTTAGKIIIFEAGSTQVIGGGLSISGAFNDFIILRSTSGGGKWNIDPQGAKGISFVDVQDSNNISTSAIITSNSKNTGNNTNWYFFEELLAGQQSGSIVLRSVLPDSGYLTQFQINIFVPTGGPVYLYHPLTPSDISAFEEMEAREEEEQKKKK